MTRDPMQRPDPGPGVVDFSGPSARTVYNEAPPDTRYGISWRVAGKTTIRGCAPAFSAALNRALRIISISSRAGDRS